MGGGNSTMEGPTVCLGADELYSPACYTQIANLCSDWPSYRLPSCMGCGGCSRHGGFSAKRLLGRGVMPKSEEDSNGGTRKRDVTCQGLMGECSSQCSVKGSIAFLDLTARSWLAG